MVSLYLVLWIKQELWQFLCVLSVYFCSFMGRGVIDLSIREIADFISKVESAFAFEKFLIVSYSSS